MKLDIFEDCSCVICGNKTNNVLYKEVYNRFNFEEHFTIVECDQCKFKYLNPRPSIEYIGQYYNSDEYQPHNLSKKSFFDRTYYKIRSINLKIKRKLIFKYRKKGRLLDIGCATGEFLLEMKKNGWAVSGMETDIDAADFARNQGLDVVNSLEKLDESYDVITMWHVMEHVHNLSNLFSQINRLIQKNGLIVIALPNPNCFDAKFFNDKWVALDVPRHLYFFTPQDMNRLLLNNNYTIAKTVNKLHFDPWYNAMLSSQITAHLKNNKGALKIIFTTFIVGFISFVYGLLQSKKASSPIYIVKKG